MFHWGLPFTISYAAWVAMEIWISARDRHPRNGARKDQGSLAVLIIAYFVALTAVAPYRGPSLGPASSLSVTRFSCWAWF